MLYTRKGDSGTTGLFGTKDRYLKDSYIYEALGTLDELNALLGLVFAHSKAREVRMAQHHLFVVQAALAGAEKSLEDKQLDELEREIDTIEAQIVNPHSFVVAGESELSAWFDYARAVSRRAERAVLRARSFRKLSPQSYAYLNRLSSLLYALARRASAMAGVAESKPHY